MRRGLFAVGLLVAGGCGGDDGGTSTPDGTQKPAESTTSAAVPSTAKPEGGEARPALGAISAVVCDNAPTRLGADAEVLTEQSWKCAKGGEQIRIDLYANDAEQQAAQTQILAFYRGAGDKRSLAELPIVCGMRFGVGSDTNASRDAFITALTSAGIAASTC